MKRKKLTTPLGKRRQLVRQLEQNFDQEKALFVEAAGAFSHKGLQVPQEIAEALGAIDNRSRMFHQVSKLLLETETGLGIEILVDRFLEDIKPHNETVARAIKVLRDPMLTDQFKGSEA